MPIIVTPVFSGGGGGVSSITNVGYSINEPTSRSNTLTITLPTGIQTNDLLVLIVCSYGQAVNVPSGWTARFGTGTVDHWCDVSVLTKVASGTETTQTITWPTPDMHVAYAMVLRGAVFSKAAIYTDTSGNTIQAPQLTGLSAGSYVVAVTHSYGTLVSGTHTWPGELTKLIDQWSTRNDSYGNYNRDSMAARSGVPAGSVGPYSVTANPSSNYTSATIAFALNLP
ncbi:hypothetical protein PBI_GRAY_33 [Gordonia phage Gray]|uniref:Uncharacterized protein n=1 Tax=Gordonia phage Chidiebere TaxID=2656530 RepID=A0A649VL51_9CAUD|nr:hypothetical protein PQD14_gp033 [Gordonia phage Chidiebere]AZS07887.1 hypothetical protein PBI_GRAY_33 [Gordonia phage Gray]QGJ92924.1 hypothetical protein PBI_CHIDIEBERE_33 [Gordonia phage Chidiebere]